MRVKDLWAVFPLPVKLRLFWDRITLSKTATFYFVFSVLHCVVQVIFQVQAFRINVQAAHLLASIAQQGDAIDSDAFYVFESDLRLCDNVPASFSTASCQVIWDGMLGNNTLTPTSSRANATALSLDAIEAVPPSSSTTFKRHPFGDIEAVEVSNTVQVVVSGLGQNNESVVLNGRCLWALGWPIQILRNTEREDLTFIAFQVWALGMSIVALLNESVPHTIASLLTHMVATAWAGFQVFNTAQFRRDFAEVTTNGACHPINLLPSYWQSRAAAEIPSLVLNAVALLVSASLSWRLAKSFGWQTFKRVGASLIISRTYKLVLSLSIVIQLSLFFIVTSIALWLDQLWSGAIGHLASSSPVHKPLLIITLILLVPWLALGWFSVRRERKLGMLIFLVMCLGYLGGWGAMFGSTTFRWTYMTWTFFGVMTTASVFLTLISFILGVVCRINFGHGLPRYLNPRGPLPGDDFEPVTFGSDLEKVAFPSSNKPTFSATFGLGQQVRSPAQMFAPSTWQHVARPMRMSSQNSLQRPSLAKTRPSPDGTSKPLHRYPSHSSVNSSVSTDRNVSAGL
ncbi:hypothetical protein PAXRUDRAFT_822394 [Paxillus rubicundulus Ve08.2h10]|uniref:Uncharacterized protein n=1 Tax=Paxillus rubicundulus Ve08.2h10 TaxID=930991 RepID=A0A0D0DM52_9AGAM|nr:hypothetical protein PAXRUDRAFT_822394 [Paxillus rubicundulus Ve08.2h10]